MQKPQSLKIVLVGDQNIGKRSLLNKVFNVPTRKSVQRVALENNEVKGIHKGQPFKLEFNDSLLPNNLSSKVENRMREIFYPEVLANSHAVFLCYACDDIDSLLHLEDWCHIIKQHASPSTLIYLVGTRCDSEFRMKDNISEMMKKIIGAIHGDFKVSARFGTNTRRLFSHLLNSFDMLPAVFRDFELTRELVPQMSCSLDKSAINISVTTPKGTHMSCRRLSSKGMDSFPDVGAPVKEGVSKDMFKAKEKDVLEIETSFREVSFLEKSTVRSINNLDNTVSYSQGKIFGKSSPRLQEVRAGGPMDLPEIGFSSGVTSPNFCKTGKSDQYQVLSNLGRKDIERDLTALEGFEGGSRREKEFFSPSGSLQNSAILYGSSSEKREVIFPRKVVMRKVESKEKSPDPQGRPKFGESSSLNQLKRHGYVLNIWC